MTSPTSSTSGAAPTFPRTVGYWAEAVTDPEQARALLALHGAAGLGGDLNIDGSIGSHTAHLRTGYADDPSCLGTAYRSSADVRDHVAACAVAGIQSGFHVIGDAGMDTVLDGLRRRRRAGRASTSCEPRDHGWSTRRWWTPTASRGWRGWGWSRASSPRSTPSGAATAGMYEARLGSHRVPGTNPFGDMARAGVRLALRLGLPGDERSTPGGAVRAAVEHHQPDQRLDVGAAVAAHTEGGHAAAREDGAGVLRVGGPATFAVWDGATVGDAGLPDVRDGVPLPTCRLTVRDGVVLAHATDRPLHDRSCRERPVAP